MINPPVIQASWVVYSNKASYCQVPRLLQKGRTMDCQRHGPLQEKMRESQEQLRMLTHEMNKLATEKMEMETRNRILKHMVRVNADCIDRLQSHKVGPALQCLSAELKPIQDPLVALQVYEAQWIFPQFCLPFQVVGTIVKLTV